MNNNDRKPIKRRKKKIIIALCIVLSIIGIGYLMVGINGAYYSAIYGPLQSENTIDNENDDDYSYAIIDTGQTYCYNNDGDIIVPDEDNNYFGQDANYEGISPDYEDNGDGTVKDHSTGLMWQQATDAKVTFEKAVEDADDFKLAGHDDWRLPTIKELYSLIMFEGETGMSSLNANPYIDIKYFEFGYGNILTGERYIDAQYWSSTEYVSTTMDDDETVFGVNFADGRIKGYPKNFRNGDKEMFVRYVRGNNEYGINNFTNNFDGTITDNATGLMWAAEDSGEGMDWKEALEWVQDMNDENYLGYDDWRLPNAKELQSIVNYTRAPDKTDSAAIDSIFNISSIDAAAEYPYFWTSTTHLDGNPVGDYAVYIAFGDAMGYMELQGEDLELMDVHGAGAQRSDPKSGDADDFPEGHGPQGDVIMIENYVRLVRGGVADEQTSEEQPTLLENILVPLIVGAICAVGIVGIIILRKRIKKGRGIPSDADDAIVQQ